MGLLLWLATPSGFSQAESSQPSPSLLGLRLPADSIVLWKGRTHMVPFLITPSKDEKRTLAPYLQAGADLIKIVEPPVILAGQSVGYFRVASLGTGRTMMFLDGVRLEIENKALPRASQAFDGHPEITSPSEGFHTWEAFDVAVEFRPAPVPFSDPSDLPSLLLPDGRLLKPHSTSLPEDGLPIRCLFQIRKTDLPEGPFTLAARTRSGTALLNGHMHQKRPEFLLEDEFEKIDPSWPRFQRIGDNPPKIMKDEKASGNEAINNAGANPAWSRPLEVPAEGVRVQFAIRARATPGQGAFPTVSAYLDDQLESPVASVRLASKDWAWIPLGPPLHLKGGTYPLTISFRNDFYDKTGGDRNLYLDAYQIARLPDAPSVRPGELKISWENWFDGRTISETLPLRAHLWLAESRENIPPKTRLILNGETLYEQTGQSRARFLLPSSKLKKGVNEVFWQAEWEDRGQHLSAQTPKQRLFKNAELNDGYEPETHPFTAEDPAWSAESRENLNFRAQKGEPCLALYNDRTLALDLNPALQGKFTIDIQGKGDVFEGRPEIQASLVSNGTIVELGKCAFDGGWNFRSAGRVQLPSGTKQLRFRFINDHFVEKKGDRNVFISAVHLIRARDEDKLPPKVTILYPPPDHPVHGTDAVVAEVLENERIQKIDLWIDGKAQGIDVSLGIHGGPVLLPLLLRKLSPGPHEVQVVATDQAGNMEKTPALSVQVLAQRPSVLGPYARAVRILQRFGYGPEPSALAALLSQGETAWLQKQLHAEPLFCHDLAAYPNDQDNGHLRARIIRHHLTTPNPVQSRFLNWSENHFSTWDRKTGTSYEYQEHLRFGALGDAPFREYLLTSATSPGMLYYLDQQSSYAGRLNENYAREILELHTLGVKGGYTQQDVTSLARLLTGWTLSSEAPLQGPGRNLVRVFRFVPQMNDPMDGPKDFAIVGWPFQKENLENRADRIRTALDLVSDHPSTARYITSKLIHHYHLMPAPESLEQELAATFTRSGGDMTEVIRHIARHPSFWDPEAKPRLATPLDFSLRLARLVGENNPYPILDFLGKSGMGLYDRATPDGYPEEDEAYADSNALLQRWRFAQQLENRIFQLLPRAWRAPREGETEEAYLTRIIDCYALRLTGNLLSERSQQATLLLAQTCKLQHDERLKLIGVFVCQLPEASLR